MTPAIARRVAAKARWAVVTILVLPIRAYQVVLSPLLGPRCRFYPSCSAYAVEALRTHGPVRGTLLAGRRLLRCHPWNPGGIDPVPRSTHPSTPTSAPSGADPTARAPQGAGT
ncbi:MAG: membrane protein insertion efficiency factor YidD [Actinomycetes bacterium]